MDLNRPGLKSKMAYVEIGIVAVVGLVLAVALAISRL